MITKRDLVEAKTAVLTAALQLRNIRGIEEKLKAEEATLANNIGWDVLDGAVQNLSSYRTLISLIPERIKEAQSNLQDQSFLLVQTCKLFILDYLNPRLENQLEQARETVRIELKNVLTDNKAIEAKIESSLMVTELKGLIDATNRQKDLENKADPVGFADTLLGIAHKSEEMEEMEGRLKKGSIWNRLISPALKS